MPDLSSLRLNLAGRELVEESPRHRMWRDAAGVFLKVDASSAPADWPFDRRDPDGARAFFATDIARFVEAIERMAF